MGIEDVKFAEYRCPKGTFDSSVISTHGQTCHCEGSDYSKRHSMEPVREVPQAEVERLYFTLKNHRQRYHTTGVGDSYWNVSCSCGAFHTISFSGGKQAVVADFKRHLSHIREREFPTANDWAMIEFRIHDGNVFIPKEDARRRS